MFFTKARMELRQFFEGNTVLLEMGPVVTVGLKKNRKMANRRWGKRKSG